MKKLILIALMLIPLSLSAKKLTFADIVDKYGNTEGYTIVDIGPKCWRSWVLHT
jgi:hypothetical protein